MKAIVILWVILMLVLSGVEYDHISKAWDCRCDSCCEYLDRVMAFEFELDRIEGSQE